MRNDSAQRDWLRLAAIASQTVGLLLIVALQTCLPPAQAQPAQAVVLGLMVATALALALLRRYRRLARLRKRQSPADSTRVPDDTDR